MISIITCTITMLDFIMHLEVSFMGANMSIFMQMISEFVLLLVSCILHFRKQSY